MAKRKRQDFSETPEKIATPENPKPDAPSKIHVNPFYDQMPDVIEDPAAVFKLAYLDMKQTAANNKLAYLAQDFQRKLQILEAERLGALNNMKAEIRRIEDARREQKEHIEKTYNISLRSYTYDDLTGVLTKQALVEEKKDEPVAEPAAVKENTLH